MKTFGTLARLTRLMLSAGLGTRRSLVNAFGLEAVVISMGVAGPYALKLLIDALDGPARSPLQLVLFILLFVGCWAGASIVETARLACTADMVDALARHFTTQALAAALPDITAARDSQSGRVPGMLERLPYSLTLVVEGLIWRLGPVFLQAIASLAVIASLIQPRYVLVLALTLLGFVGATWIGARRHRVHADATNAAASHVSRTIGDIVRNARRVVLNGALDRELRYADDILRAKRQATASMYRSLTVMAALQFCIFGVGLVALLMLAGLDVGNGHMTAGDFVLLQTYAFRLTVPLSALGYILAQAGVAIANIRDVLAFTNAHEVPRTTQLGPTGAADLTVEDVSFCYGDNMPAINGVSLLSRRAASSRSSAPTARANLPLHSCWPACSRLARGKSRLRGSILQRSHGKSVTAIFSMRRNSSASSIGRCGKTSSIPRRARRSTRSRNCLTSGVSMSRGDQSTSRWNWESKASVCREVRSRSWSSRGWPVWMCRS